MRIAVLALFLAAAAPVLAGEARADEALMVQPIQAASLTTETVNLIAYYVPLADEGYEVTVTWLGAEDAEASRLQMRLADGDRVTFSLPGHPEMRFTFARTLDVVAISSAPIAAPTRTASL